MSYFERKHTDALSVEASAVSSTIMSTVALDPGSSKLVKSSMRRLVRFVHVAFALAKAPIKRFLLFLQLRW
jgi:hypothetical protein